MFAEAVDGLVRERFAAKETLQMTAGPDSPTKIATPLIDIFLFHFMTLQVAFQITIDATEG